MQSTSSWARRSLIAASGKNGGEQGGKTDAAIEAAVYAGNVTMISGGIIPAQGCQATVPDQDGLQEDPMTVTRFAYRMVLLYGSAPRLIDHAPTVAVARSEMVSELRSGMMFLPHWEVDDEEGGKVRLRDGHLRIMT